jgi:transcriptional regulator GlxA family with amidase domain
MRRLDGHTTRNFGFFLVPRFAMLAFTSALEPLRAANLLSGRELYRWCAISRDGRPVAASNGLQIIAEASIESLGSGARDLDDIMVCSGLDAHVFGDKAVFAWLRRAAREGVRIGAVSDGAFILARAGLLNGYKCTIHWQCLPGFAETFPDIAVDAELYRIDRNRMTASGGTAALDLMLHLIEMDHGRDLAIAVAEQLLHERIRGDEDRQRMPLRVRLGLGHPKVLEVITLMEENLEEPISCVDLAERCGVSTRQMERLFRKYLGRTPRRYYLQLRLQRARRLLNESSLPVMEVALACGFVSPSHFAKCYREQYKQVPKSTRQSGAIRSPAAPPVAAE